MGPRGRRRDDGGARGEDIGDHGTVEPSSFGLGPRLTRLRLMQLIDHLGMR